MTIQPELHADFAWNAARFDPSPVWVDETENVREIIIERGAKGAADQAQAGTCTIVLNNHHRRYDPTGSELGAACQPGTPVRIRGVIGGFSHTISYGFIEDIHVSIPTTFESVARITCTDAIKVLAMVDLPYDISFHNMQTTQLRVHALLDIAEWPWTKRNLGMASNVILANRILEQGTNVLDVVRKIATETNNIVYVNRLGTFVMRSAFLRDNHQQTTAVGIGGIPCNIPGGVSYHDRTIINEVSIQPRGDQASVARSEESIERYGRNTLVISDAHLLPFTAEDWPGVIANWIVRNRQFPLLKLGEIEMLGTTNAHWSGILGIDQETMVRVRLLPPGNELTEIDHLGVVRYIRHAITSNGVWRCWIECDPIATNGWRLGVAGETELSQTTRLPL